MLTFIHEDTLYNDFLSKNEMIFYKDIEDLSYKLNKYQKDHKDRKRIAKNGKNKYFNLFNETKISKYIIDKSIGKNANLF